LTEGLVRAYDEDGRLLALLEIEGDKSKPKKVFVPGL
jgi:hypothetical protein